MSNSIRNSRIYYNAIINITIALCSINITHGQSDTYKFKCGFSINPIPVEILAFAQPLDPKFEKLINLMYARSGGGQITIGNSDAPTLDFACCGVNQLNQPVIFINERQLNKLSYFSQISIIAHEIGHIHKSHVYTTIPVTSDDELAADNYNGLWASQNGVGENQLDDLLKVYDLIGDDNTHPKKEFRKAAVKNGYNFAKSSFPSTIGYDPNTRKDTVFAKSMNFIITVNPAFIVSDNLKKYDVNLSIQNIDNFYSNLEIFQSIERVRYIIHPSFGTGGNQLLTSFDSDNNFKAKLTRVWGTFPITAIITFNDESEIIFHKYFELPK